MLDEDSRSLKALSMALDQLREPLDEQTQNKLNQAVKDLRQAIREYSPLLEIYNAALDQLQNTTESQPRNKFINLSAQSTRDKITQKTPLEIFEENGLVGCFEEDSELSADHQSEIRDYLMQKRKQGRL
jgi:type VI protein secretion system component VasK